MLVKIAWRNIWRNRSRSIVVIASIVVGIWALLFGTGFMNAFMVGYSADIIEHDISNIQPCSSSHRIYHYDMGFPS